MQEEASKAFQEALIIESIDGLFDWDALMRRFPEDHEEIKRKLNALRRFFPHKHHAMTDRLLTPGKTVSGYRIQKVLGEGSTGIAFLADHPRLNRQVVLKVIRPFLAKRDNIRERFLRESRLVAKLSHPNIMSVEDVGETEDLRPFLVMPYLPTASLDRLLAALPPESRTRMTRDTFIRAWCKASGHNIPGMLTDSIKSPINFLTRMVLELAKALLYAHANGIVHRDVKPGNILIRSDGVPIFVDFGLGFDENEPALTMTGDFLGTPAYCPPESVWNQTNESKNWPLRDLYGLAATLYELMTGRPPYIGGDFVTTLQTMRDKDPPPAKTLDPSLPIELAAIMDKGVNKEISARYKSLSEFAEDLESFIAGKSVRAKPAGWWHFTISKLKKRRIQITLLTLTLIASSFWLFTTHKLNSEKNHKEAVIADLKSWIRNNGASSLDIAKTDTLANFDDPKSWLTLALIAFDETSRTLNRTSPEAQNNFRLVIAAFEQARTLGAIELTPLENYALAQSLVLTGEYAKAKPILENTVKKLNKEDPNNKWLYTRIVSNLGAIAYETKNLPVAIKYFQDAVLYRDDNNAFPFFFLATALKDDNRHLEALKTIEEGLTISPGDFQLRLLRLNITEDNFPEKYEALSTQERQQGGATYRNEILSITFKAPFGWIITGDTRYASLVRYTPPTESMAEEVFHPPSVSLFELENVFTSDELFKREVSVARDSEMGNLINRKYTIQRRESGIIIDSSYDGIFGPLKVKIKERAILKPDGKAYVLVCSAPETTFSNYEIDFVMALGSFEE